MSTRTEDAAAEKPIEPPNDGNAERAVLGAVLLDSSMLPAVRQILTAGEFYRESHGLIFTAMQQLADAGSPIDPVTLTARVAPFGLQRIVAGLLDGVPHGMNVAHHAQIVREKAWRRQLAGALDKAGKLAANGVTPDEVLAAVEPITALARDGATLGGRVLRRYDATHEPTPREMITRETPAGSVVLIAGEGGTGKSYAELERAHAVAAGIGEFGRTSFRDPRPVLILDAENGEDLSVRRLQAISRAAGTDLERIQERLVILDGLGFNLDSETDLGALRREVEQLSPALIILDSAVALHERDENDSVQIRGLMDRRIRPLTRICGSCVILLHHLRKKGGMADLDGGAQRVRGASGWVDGADEVFVYRSGRRRPDRSRASEGAHLRLLSTVRPEEGSPGAGLPHG